MSTRTYAPHNHREYPASPGQRGLIETLLVERNVAGSKYEGWTPDWSKATSSKAKIVINELKSLPYAKTRRGYSNAELAKSSATVARESRPRADFSKIPESFYCLEDSEGEMEFFSVTVGKDGSKWAGFRFVEKCIGAPGDWRKSKYRGAQAAAILSKIAADEFTDYGPVEAPFETPVEYTGPKAASVRYARHFTVCSSCNSPLSDPESVARAMGPVCAGRF